MWHIYHGRPVVTAIVEVDEGTLVANLYTVIGAEPDLCVCIIWEGVVQCDAGGFSKVWPFSAVQGDR